jgi:hypothetical protein
MRESKIAKAVLIYLKSDIFSLQKMVDVNSINFAHLHSCGLHCFMSSEKTVAPSTWLFH